ncbi:MAG: hypothetical protein D6712_20350, partial [Chloroflexi bacterium]
PFAEVEFGLGAEVIITVRAGDMLDFSRVTVDLDFLVTSYLTPSDPTFSNGIKVTDDYGNSAIHNGFDIEVLRGSPYGADLYEVYGTGDHDVILDGMGGSDNYMVYFPDPNNMPAPTPQMNVTIREGTDGTAWTTDTFYVFGSAGPDVITVTNKLIVADIGTGTPMTVQYSECDDISPADGECDFIPTAYQGGIDVIEVYGLGDDDVFAIPSTPNNASVSVNGDDAATAPGKNPQVFMPPVTPGDDIFVVGYNVQRTVNPAGDNITRLDGTGAGFQNITLINLVTLTNQVADGEGGFETITATLNWIDGSSLTGPLVIKGGFNSLSGGNLTGRDLLYVTDFDDTADSSAANGTAGQLAFSSGEQLILGMGLEQGISFSGIEDLDIQLGQGNDEFTFNYTLPELEGQLRDHDNNSGTAEIVLNLPTVTYLRMGAGDDTVVIAGGNPFYGNLLGEGGNDQFFLTDNTVIHTVTVDANVNPNEDAVTGNIYGDGEQLDVTDGNDIIWFGNNTQIEGDVFGGNGHDILDYTGNDSLSLPDLTEYTEVLHFFLQGIGTQFDPSAPFPAAPIADGFYGVERGTGDELTLTGDESISRTFDSIDEINSGGAYDQLDTLDRDSVWNIDEDAGNTDNGVNTYTDVNRFGIGTNNDLHFRNIEKMNAGDLIDIVNIRRTELGDFSAGAGHDEFVFYDNATFGSDGGAITGTIDGNGGADTLNYADYTSPVNVNLTTTIATANGVNTVVLNFIAIIGGQAGDTLTGDAGDNYIIGRGGNDTLNGHLGNDTYGYEDNWGQDTINDLAGDDTIDFSAAYRNGADALLNFLDPDNPAIYFVAASANLLVTIGAIAAMGRNSGDITIVTGADENCDIGDNCILTDINVENIIGGAGNDTFAFKDGEILPGYADGYTGDDTLDFSDYTVGVDVTMHELALIPAPLPAPSATPPAPGPDIVDGFNGTVTDVVLPPATPTLNIVGNNFAVGSGTDYFRNMDIVVGSSATDDRIRGMTTDATWDISYPINPYNTYTETTSGNNHDMRFNGVEDVYGGDAVDTFNISGNQGVQAGQAVNLFGGNADDTFAFADGATLTGRIDGQGNSDWLDFSAYTTPVTVNIEFGQASAISPAGGSFGDPGGFERVPNVRGGQNNDVLTGDAFVNIILGEDGNDIITGQAGNDDLRGGAGDDRYVYDTAWGSDTITELAGEGTDFLDFSLFAQGLIFDITTTSVIITDAGGTNTVTNNNQYVEGLIGGTGDDRFIFRDTAVLSGGNGVIDGNSGIDTVEYFEYTTPVTVNLSTNNATGLAANGIWNIASGGADTGSSIENIIGGTVADNLTGDGDLNLIIGLGGGDTLSGMGGADTLFGNDGNDTLLGGAGDDVLSGGLGADSIDGGADSDTLNESTNQTSLTAITTNTNDMTINLNDGSASGTDIGTDTAGSIVNVENATTGNGNDTLVSSSGGINPADNILLGGIGDDTYQFLDNWGNDTVTENAAEGNDTIDYSGATVGVNFLIGTTQVTDGACGVNNCLTYDVNSENLIGGTGDDNFIFADGSTVTGNVDGQAGNDTLDYTAYLSDRNIQLTGLGTIDGFTGTEASIGGAFDNINNLIGSTDAAVTDSLAGIPGAAATWNLGASYSYESGGRTLTFDEIDTLVSSDTANIFNITGNQPFNLTGGAGDDQFNFADGATLAGFIHGLGGNDTINFSGYTTV